MPANSEPNVPAAARAPRASRLGFGSARLDEYFGVWAIDPAQGEALAQRASRLNLRLHVEQQEQAADETPDAADPAPVSRFGDAYGETLLEDGTAIIRVEGTLMKFASSMSRGTGTVQLRRMVRGARNDASVLRVMVVIDSPGGTVAGTQALAQDLADLAAAKPVHVFVEDLMASAALWIGVQGTTISASPTALVGSIGTFMAVADYSKWAAKEGVKVHLITTGAYKGAGTPGTKVSAEQLAEWQRVVDGLNGHFLNAVASGRRLSLAKVTELADGRVHLAEDARKLGLVDHVEGLDAAMNRLRGIKSSAKPVGARVDANEQPAAAADVPAEQSNTQETGANASEPDMSQQTTTAAAAAVVAAAAAAPTAVANGAAATAPVQQPAVAAAEPKPASLGELKAAFPNDLAFAVEMYEAGHALVEANSIDAIVQRRVAAAKPAEQPATQQQEAATRKPGVQPVQQRAAEQKPAAAAGAAGAGGDVVAEFEARVKTLTVPTAGLELDREWPRDVAGHAVQQRRRSPKRIRSGCRCPTRIRFCFSTQRSSTPRASAPGSRPSR